MKYEPQLAAVCARNKERAEDFAEQWGYESVETDWKKLIARDDIDVIDIAPRIMYTMKLLLPQQKQEGILCEKPLALNCKEGEEMVREVEKAGVPNMVWYNYRRIPAVTMAKEMIDEGRLGKIYHYRSNFLQDWTIKVRIYHKAEKASGV